MDQETVLGIVRHVLGFAGAAAVAQGYTTNDQWTVISGGVVALVAVGWSIWQKRQQKQAVAAAAAGAPVAKAGA